MQPYRDIDGDSSVEAYEIGEDYIAVKFYRSPKIYTYSYSGKAGPYHVEQMKRLARNGNGLNSYIKTHANKAYD